MNKFEVLKRLEKEIREEYPELPYFHMQIENTSYSEENYQNLKSNVLRMLKKFSN
ncbi:hypothetical protein ACORB6_002944 [Listeria monocytogenes]|nr:hypothetical protein [Listeria monocytogenes]HDU3385666.1 hypothetical protein [Listeria monocytogenes]